MYVKWSQDQYTKKKMYLKEKEKKRYKKILTASLINTLPITKSPILTIPL